MAGRKPGITDEQILEVFLASSDPILSAPEIAEEFDYSTPGIYKRLKDLETRGLLKSKKIGQGRAWWITEKGRDYV